MRLSEWGWDPFFDLNFEPYRDKGLFPVRIIRVDRGHCTAVGERGECICEISGRFRFETDRKGGFPSVGDWAAVSYHPEADRATLHALLPRKSAFSRKEAGAATEEQVAAANVDVVFIVVGLDSNFSVRRVERYLTLAWDSGALPVVLLNKADLQPDSETRLREVESAAPGTAVHVLSGLLRIGLDDLAPYLTPGRTAVFLGSSGVGKSTLINSLLGTERQRTESISGSTSKGRHTTTARELISLPSGGMLIDTPGMRELQIWGDEEGLERVFSDIENLAVNCRFRDCRHETEPGCAVREALTAGTLALDRFESFRKLKKEYAYLADRLTMKASAVEKKRWKKIAIEAKRISKGSP
jgi:ribosome biogenesis GTPase / thiamine phosphate phosphatase